MLHLYAKIKGNIWYFLYMSWQVRTVRLSLHDEPRRQLELGDSVYSVRLTRMIGQVATMMTCSPSVRSRSTRISKHVLIRWENMNTQVPPEFSCSKDHAHRCSLLSERCDMHVFIILVKDVIVVTICKVAHQARKYIHDHRSTPPSCRVLTSCLNGLIRSHACPWWDGIKKCNEE